MDAQCLDPLYFTFKGMRIVMFQLSGLLQLVGIYGHSLLGLMVKAPALQPL